MREMAPTFSERSSLSDVRTGTASLVLAWVLGVRVVTTRPVSWLVVGLLVAGASCALGALYSASRHYYWREDPSHRVPRPWVAFLAAISVALSCLAGLALAFQRSTTMVEFLQR